MLASIIHYRLTGEEYSDGGIGREEDVFKRTLNVCLHMNQINRRGVEVASYDYMSSLRESGERSYKIACLAPQHVLDNQAHKVPEVTAKFNALCGGIQAYSCTEDWKISAPGGYWQWGGPGLVNLTRHLNCHLLYSLKSGEIESPPQFTAGTMHIPWAVHAVFNTKEPHGTSFASISEEVARSTAQPNPCALQRDQLYVDHIVDFPFEELSFDLARLRRAMRHEHNIPNDALVLCRHGGESTFDIDFVRGNIATIIEANRGLHLVLMNTAELQQGHSRIHEIKGDSTVLGKATYFAGCDAMLHARADGETFGLAVAEFSLRNKPVITFNGTMDGYARTHLEILGDMGMYYHDLPSLNTLIRNLSSHGIPPRGSWNAYESFSRDKVMRKFEDVFINPAVQWWEEVQTLGIPNVWEAPFSTLPPLSLRCPKVSSSKT